MFGTSRQLSILTSCIVTLQLKVLRISKKKPKCRPNCGHVNRPQVLVFKLHHPIVPALQTPPAPLMIST